MRPVKTPVVSIVKTTQAGDNMYFCGKTDIGMKRETNQDNFLTVRICDNVLLLVLCDGMGGTNGGNIASSLAARVFADSIEDAVNANIKFNLYDTSSTPPDKLLFNAVSSANTAVFRRARANSELANMGTTLVAALIVDDKMYIANVGDSRIYLISKKKITQLTHDHSYVQMLVDIGRITKEEAIDNPRKNILTRAVGIEPSVEADVIESEIPPKGSYLLLCSDGLYNFIMEEDIKQIVLKKLKTVSSDDFELELDQKTDILIDTANENGGGDNITAILTRFTD